MAAFCVACLASLVSASVGSPLLAQSAAATAVATLRVMPGDRLAVSVFGQEQLSGKFLVDATGSIDMPVIGRIGVADLSIDEVRQRVIQELGRGVVKSPTVSVHVDEYRPFYVFGHVKTPGSYSYRPNMTVVGAMIVAGGEPLGDLASGTLAADLVSSEERVKILEARRTKLLIHIAGLEVQRDQASTFDFSTLQPEQRTGPDAEALMNAEQKRVETERGARDGELSLLNKQRPILVAEHAALLTDIQAQQRLLDINKQRMSEYSKLDKAGHLRGAAFNDISQQVALFESAVGRLKTAAAHNEFEQAALDLKIAERTNLYVDKVLTSLQGARSDIAETGIQLDAARNLRQMRRQAAGFGRSIGDRDFEYVIQRRMNGKIERLNGDSSSIVEPGDIIEVKTFGPQAVAPVAPATARQPISAPRPAGSAPEHRANSGVPGGTRLLKVERTRAGGG